MLCQTGLASLKVCDRTPMITTPGVLESFGESFLKCWQPFCAADKKNCLCQDKSLWRKSDFLCLFSATEHRSARAHWLDPWTHRHALRQSVVQQGRHFPYALPEVSNTHREKVSSSFKTNRPCFCDHLGFFFLIFSFPFFICALCQLLSLSFSVARFHRGDVLVTTATGVMTEEEGERWGLVPTHAYAVLDIRDYKVSISVSSRALRFTWERKWKTQALMIQCYQ